MSRYAAFVWDPVEGAPVGACSAALVENLRRSMPDWICAFETRGLVVFHSSKPRGDFRAYLLPDDCGIVLGMLFDSDLSVDAPVAIDGFSARQYARGGGKQFIEDYWGGYVAFFNDASSGRRYVTRDCSGKLPCFRIRAGAVNVIFSDINDLVGLPLPPFTVNWEYISAFLFYEQLQVRGSGLNEVTEILSGDIVEFRGSEVEQRVLWDPGRVARRGYLENDSRAREELRFTVQHCVERWASLYKVVIHSLSGGIDSSIVLSCLSRSPRRPAITCLNRYTDLASEDERSFARLAAQRADVRLVERDWQCSEGQFGSELETLLPTAKPSLAIIGASLDMRVRNVLAAEICAEAMWTGQGGDHLFFQERSSCGASDFMRQRGLRSGLLSAIGDAARLSGESYWAVARTAFADWRTSAPWQPSHLTGRKSYFALDSPSPDHARDYVAHPWTSGITDLPKGKQGQIWLLAEVTNRHRPAPIPELAPEHHPLLSQPLMELCLRLPTYTLLFGGRPRGLARTAFNGYVPSAILERRSKGGTTSYWMQTVRQSSSYLRELILGGTLHREKIIDGRLLDPYLRFSEPIPVAVFPRLIACISAELWLRSWSNAGLRMAA
ncbi:MAG TPA: asparagine synthase C-terminal domain-containing protein [Steroidobacteraceae bacterium]|jgi:asparagine synthase (glutamine-hydrolysing)|nr:asparagine synthase C-terminal domain-containing protein [Steroidobacteraceae bacterium]